MPIVCHLSDALLKSFFFPTSKVFTGRNFEGRTLRFLHLKDYLFRNKTLYFWFLISKIFCALSVDFSITKIQILENFGFSIIFLKI